jgi:hypothetical protein
VIAASLATVTPPERTDSIHLLNRLLRDWLRRRRFVEFPEEQEEQDGVADQLREDCVKPAT